MSFEDVLNPQIFGDAEIVAAVAAQLAEGRAVVIHNAFREELAARIHEDLLASTADGFNWIPYEGWGSYFHFRHHSLRTEDCFPRSLVECRARFESNDVRGLMARLSGAACDGLVEFGPSLYLPGDFSLPHVDVYMQRRLSFIWHLSKDWDPNWGGNFVWSPSGTQVSPQFNALVLFRVSPEGLHLVSPVSPHARGRRFAIQSWFSDVAVRDLPNAPAQELAPGVRPALYGRAQRALSSAARVIAI